MTYKALEDYFNNLEPIEETEMPLTDQYEEPMTSIYFQIRTPAVSHYPAHEHTANVQWTEGARWYDVLWEIMGVLECSYGYDIKEKVFFMMHELNIQAEQEHGNPDIAKQMLIDTGEE